MLSIFGQVERVFDGRISMAVTKLMSRELETKYLMTSEFRLPSTIPIPPAKFVDVVRLKRI